MMKEALEQAHVARMSILEKMLEVLAAPRAELKPHAPRIITVKIPVDKIGALIGPGGKNIRALQEETGTKIDIEEDGTVYIASDRGRRRQDRPPDAWKPWARTPKSAASTPARSCASRTSAPSSRSCPAWTAWSTSRSWTASASTRSKMLSTWATRSP